MFLLTFSFLLYVSLLWGLSSDVRFIHHIGNRAAQLNGRSLQLSLSSKLRQRIARPILRDRQKTGDKEKGFVIKNREWLQQKWRKIKPKSFNAHCTGCRIWLCAYTSCLMQVGEGGVDGVGGVFLYMCESGGTVYTV